MKLTFIGADHEVTGSAHLLEVDGQYALVDYGMEQGVNRFDNIPLPVDAAQISHVFLTHAHVDHSGMLPLLYAKGFRGKIYTTQASADLCSIMLRDCAHIQMMEAEWAGRKAKRTEGMPVPAPLYTMEDAVGALQCLVPCTYNSMIEINPQIQIRFTDIGHLIGSASIEIWLTEDGRTKKIVFSGDIGNKNQPLIKDPSPTAEADYVVMESTYGDRNHPEMGVDYVTELSAILNETFRAGGNVVIPSFAVGRTQEILYFLRIIKAENLVPDYPNFPVYVDSPMAVEATHVFENNELSCFDQEALELVRKKINPLSFPGLKLTITSEESKGINFQDTPKVIISASGMCDAGRIRHHLKHNLWRPECTILFVGYQSVGTLGRILVDGSGAAQSFSVKIFGEQIAVRAKIKQLTGLSGHADKRGLTEWISGFTPKPRRTFIVHGEDSVCATFAEYLHVEYKLSTYAPYSGTVFNLLSNQIEYEALPIPAKKKTKIPSLPFTRLVAAAERLLAFVKRCEGRPNKDLAKMADQINSLYSKWNP
jgi:metallo-beta-lactamase family protein